MYKNNYNMTYLKEGEKVNCITEITKRDILDLFKNGLEIENFFEIKTVRYW